MLEKRVLIAGLDDSNHGRYPEICLGCFSTISSDKDKHRFNKRRDPTLAKDLLDPNRDYRFLLLSEQDCNPKDNNLVLAAPSLIIPVIESYSTSFECLYIFIDGRLKKIDKERLKETFRRYIRPEGVVIVEGNIKRYFNLPPSKIETYYNQPYILGLADYIAHYLLTISDLQKHSKRVDFRR